MGRKRNKNKVETGNQEEQLPPNPGPNLNFVKSDLFTVDLSPVYGRYLKSKVDIKKGQIILKEKFLIAGPKLNSGPICIGCHSEINETVKTAPCPNCKWLLCNPKCQASPFHRLECKFLRDRQIQSPGQMQEPQLPSKSGPTPYYYYFGAITVLRGLLLKLHNKTGWQKLMNLQSHNYERQELTSVWRVTQNIVKIVREVWNLSELFKDEDITTVCGIFEINSFEMGDCYEFGGIFPTASMCAHSCVPNCSQSENINDLSLEIYAMVDIQAGQPLTLCYDSCIMGTRIRQLQLKRSKYFECHCARCEDPLELGTNFSTIFCSKCKKGLVTKSISDKDSGSWKCNKCPGKIPQKAVDEVVAMYSNLASTKTDIKSQEQFLIDCKNIFHPNHFVVFGVKFNLCMAYGREKGYQIEELSVSDGHRKLELCQEAMKILNVLIPGLSISRGNILYEQQAAEVLIAKNLLDGGRCSKNLIKQKLKHAVELLEEAIQIFELNYATKLLAESAKNTTLKELETWINTIK